jgi:HEAT repeat protein
MLKYDVDPTPLLPELSSMVAQQPAAPHVLEAVELIGTCGPAAAPAIPALTKLLDHSEVSVRHAAQHALSKIQ